MSKTRRNQAEMMALREALVALVQKHQPGLMGPVRLTTAR